MHTLKPSKGIDSNLDPGTPVLSVDVRCLNMETSFEVCKEREDQKGCTFHVINRKSS